ncbi:hypothetical protein K402DRAFT_468041 [Aulographum hederae CBS 113979]|uniref:Uncharacterized protein n=1 Tax=Aulographum hederae CBS 113979 TaxID=1176131 RepID=A0A6G1GIK4_9PEZI|nr:hypothetical protein K402DRAFT_468041 [Aulographum hederae CBS 113979]
MITPTRGDSPPGEPTKDPPRWTAARCQRLLRPIVSKITALERELHSQTIERLRTQCNRNRVRPSEQSGNDFSTTRDKSDQDDPDWIDTRAIRRVNKQYRKPAIPPAGKNLKKVDPKQHGGIVIPTPKIHRAMKRLEDPTIESPFTVARESQQDKASKATKDIYKALDGKVKVDGAKLKILNGLMKDFEGLLEATDPNPAHTSAAVGFWKFYMQAKPRSPNRKGARSLLATCARRIPQYIEMEQARQSEEKVEDRVDVVKETYAYLENMGVCEGSGWRDLRRVVRAHGTYLLLSAVTETMKAGKCLGSVMLRMLLAVCNKHKAREELDDLITAFVSRIGQHDEPFGSVTYTADRKDFALLNELGHLESWGEDGTQNPEPRHLLTLIKSGTLPAEWISIDGMRPMWAKVTLAVAFQDRNFSSTVTELYQEVLRASCGQRDPSEAAGVTIFRPAILLQFDAESYHRKFFVQYSDVIEDPTEYSVNKQKGTQNDSVDTVYTSVAFVAATSLMLKDANKSTPCTRLRMLEDVAQSIIHGFFEAPRPSGNDSNIRADGQAKRSAIILTAALVLRIQGVALEPHLVHMDINTCIACINKLFLEFCSRRSGKSPRMFLCLGQLLVQIARDLSRFRGGGARGEAVRGEEVRDEVRMLLETLADYGDEHPEITAESRWFLWILALETAEHYANLTRQKEDSNLRTCVEVGMRKYGLDIERNPFFSPHKERELSVGPKGCVWDDAIQEWIPKQAALVDDRVWDTFDLGYIPMLRDRKPELSKLLTEYSEPKEKEPPISPWLKRGNSGLQPARPVAVEEAESEQVEDEGIDDLANLDDEEDELSTTAIKLLKPLEDQPERKSRKLPSSVTKETIKAPHDPSLCRNRPSANNSLSDSDTDELSSPFGVVSLAHRDQLQRQRTTRRNKRSSDDTFGGDSADDLFSEMHRKRPSKRTRVDRHELRMKSRGAVFGGVKCRRH